MKGKDKLVWKPVSPDSMSFLHWDPFPTSEVLVGLLCAPSDSPNNLLYPERWGTSVESHCKIRNPVKTVVINTYIINVRCGHAGAEIPRVLSEAWKQARLQAGGTGAAEAA